MTPDRRRDAALVVCGHATDTDDARQLLTQSKGRCCEFGLQRVGAERRPLRDPQTPRRRARRHEHRRGVAAMALPKTVKGLR